MVRRFDFIPNWKIGPDLVPLFTICALTKESEEDRAAGNAFIA